MTKITIRIPNNLTEEQEEAIKLEVLKRELSLGQSND